MKTRAVAVAAGFVAVIALVSGCSSDSESKESTTTTAGDNTQVVAPQILTIEQLDQVEVTITEASPLVIKVDGDAEGWTGQAEDPKVAEFVPGGAKDGAEFNPGFDAKSDGTTKASVTSPDGTTTDFTIIVADELPS